MNAEETINRIKEDIVQLIEKFNTRQKYLDKTLRHGQTGYSISQSHLGVIYDGKMWLMHKVREYDDRGVICTIFSDAPEYKGKVMSFYNYMAQMVLENGRIDHKVLKSYLNTAERINSKLMELTQQIEKQSIEE